MNRINLDLDAYLCSVIFTFTVYSVFQLETNFNHKPLSRQGKKYSFNLLGLTLSHKIVYIVCVYVCVSLNANDSEKSPNILEKSQNSSFSVTVVKLRVRFKCHEH